MFKRIFFIFLFNWVLISIFSCNESSVAKQKKIKNHELNSISNNTELYIDIEKIFEAEVCSNVLNVQVVYDHYFKTFKEYKGYYINPIIDSFVKANGFDTTNVLVIFECSDGYKPIIDIAKLYGKTKGYIVYKDLGEKGENNWPDSVMKKFGKYYVVWDNVPKDDESFVWPYDLKGIHLIAAEKEYRSIYPFKKTTLLKGFNLFRNNCMKCHSINKVGGIMGPELNYPKNITEYWKEDDIVSFVNNPASYRNNSSMPSLEGHLNDAEIREILNYIKYMKDYKLKE